jgi:hypothetical protein
VVQGMVAQGMVRGTARDTGMDPDTEARYPPQRQGIRCSRHFQTRTRAGQIAALQASARDVRCNRRIQIHSLAA